MRILKLLVTGGLGFIGSNFIRYMFKKHSNLEITNLDNLSCGANPANLRDIEKDPNYKWVNGSIADKNLVTGAMKDIDAVVNMAAETHVDRSISNPKPFFESNTLGTFILLEVARKAEIDKFVQVSTDEVFGDITTGSFREDDPVEPSNPYAASKASAEMFCLAYQRTYGLDVTITRCTNNFGPYQHLEKLIPKTIIRAKLNLPIPIYGKGTNVREWIYVLDHCEAINIIIENAKSGDIYNISSGNELSNLEVAEAILKALGKNKDLFDFVEDRPGHDFRYSLDSSKIRSLGWTPTYSFDQSLNMTIEWYLQNEWWWKPLVSERTLHPTPWRI